VTALLGVGAVLALATGAAGGAPDVLEGLTRLAVAVRMEEAVDGVSDKALAARLLDVVPRLSPGLIVDDTSEDRLTLTVAVRPYSSSALRGFPLPFSGRYGIGTVRLALERRVRFAHDPGRTIAAVVWQSERRIATRWSLTGRAVSDAVGDLGAELGRARASAR
jgi:hypothetical protein